ncbi:unnamed protein product [Diamesa serratosioi]
MTEINIQLNEDAFIQEMSSDSSFKILDGKNEGAIFELNPHEITDNEKEVECLVEELLNKKYDKLDVSNHKNPCSTSFEDFRKEMDKVSHLIYKKITKKGDGELVDLESCKIMYEYNFYLEHESDPFDSSYINNKPACVCWPLGLDTFSGYTEAISTMTNKEEALFCISYKLLFGDLGSPPRIPPKSDILCAIKILSVKIINQEEIVTNNDPLQAKSFKKALEKCSELKNKAKSEFKNLSFYEAIESYKKAIDILENAHLTNEKQQNIQQNLLISIRSNLCVCYNKTRNPQKTCIQMREIERLTSINNNPKMLYAKGRALTLLSDYVRARILFNAAIKLAPKSIEIQEAIAILDERENDEKSFEKNFVMSTYDFMAEADIVVDSF